MLVIEYKGDRDMVLRMELPTPTGTTHIELRQAFLNFLRGMGYVIDDEEDLV